MPHQLLRVVLMVNLHRFVDSGFPGQLTVQVTYGVTEHNDLTVHDCSHDGANVVQSREPHLLESSRYVALVAVALNDPKRKVVVMKACSLHASAGEVFSKLL